MKEGVSLLSPKKKNVVKILTPSCAWAGLKVLGTVVSAAGRSRGNTDWQDPAGLYPASLVLPEREGRVTWLGLLTRNSSFLGLFVNTQ